MTAPPTRDGPRVNEEIRAPQVRLIDQDGEMQGVMSARDALLRAQARRAWTCWRSAPTPTRRW